MTRMPITKEGRVELQQKLERLRAKQRQNIGLTANARQHAAGRVAGGMRRNPEYHLLAAEQRSIEIRIRELEEILGACQVIDPATVGADGRCIFGAYVRLRDGEGGEISYRLVGEYEANVDLGLLSTASPAGRALLGKYAGEFIHVPAPGGVVEYELLEVRYEIEAQDMVAVAPETAPAKFPQEKESPEAIPATPKPPEKHLEEKPDISLRASQKRVVDGVEVVSRKRRQFTPPTPPAPSRPPVVHPRRPHAEPSSPPASQSAPAKEVRHEKKRVGFWRRIFAALLSFFRRSPRK